MIKMKQLDTTRLYAEAQTKKGTDSYTFGHATCYVKSDNGRWLFTGNYVIHAGIFNYRIIRDNLYLYVYDCRYVFENYKELGIVEFIDFLPEDTTISKKVNIIHDMKGFGACYDNDDCPNRGICNTECLGLDVLTFDSFENLLVQIELDDELDFWESDLDAYKELNYCSSCNKNTNCNRENCSQSTIVHTQSKHC